MFVWGAEPGDRGGGGGTRGIWNSSQVTAVDILLWVGMGGCGGQAMMGVRRVVGKGVGRGFNQSFEQNRYRYIEFGYHYAYYETKLAKNRDFEGVTPILAGNPHIMTS